MSLVSCLGSHVYYKGATLREKRPTKLWFHKLSGAFFTWGSGYPLQFPRCLLLRWQG